MFIDDYIEKVTLQEELKNVKEQLKTVQDENTELKTAIDWYHKADMEKRRIILDKNEKIAMLENDRKEGLLTCCNCSHKFQDQIEGLKNKVKSLEEEVRHLQWEKDYLAKQVEHLQSCLDFEKNKD